MAGINSGNSLAGLNERRETRKSRDSARASENPLALFEEAERSRRRRKKREPETVHLVCGRIDPESGRLLRPALSKLDEAEIERLLKRFHDGV